MEESEVNVESPDEIKDNQRRLVVKLATFAWYIIFVNLVMIGEFGHLVFPDGAWFAYNDSYSMTFGLAPWAQLIWLPVCFWQFFWLKNALLTSLWKDEYVTFYLPDAAYPMFSCALPCILVAQTARAHGYVMIALVFQWFAVETLDKTINYARETSQKHKNPIDVGKLAKNHYVIINGLDLFIGWIEFNFFLLYGEGLEYYFVECDSAGIAIVVFYALYNLVGTVMDIFKWDDEITCTYTPHIVQIWCVLSWFASDGDTSELMGRLKIAITVFIVILAVVRILVNMFLR